MEPPKGRQVTAAEAAPLFAEIESIRAQLGARRIDVVLITTEFNAGITQVPRLGLLGWNRNYLTLGLPLLAALSPEEFRAVLAHELGHCARDHARFANWIYRIRRTWTQLLAMLEERGGAGAKLFVPFFNWYAPYFNAYSFVLARANELEADSAAARVAGREATAQALMRVHAQGDYLEQAYWGRLYERLGRDSEAPAHVYTAALAAIDSMPLALGQSSIDRALERSVGSAAADFDDSHPSLAERLRALGLVPRFEPRQGPSAASVLLDESVPTLVAEYDAQWTANMALQWRIRHERMRDSRERLVALERALEERSLVANEAWERIVLLRSLEGRAAAASLLGEFALANPDHAQAQLAHGVALLEADDASGVACLERAFVLDEETRSPAAQCLLDYYRRRGDPVRMDRYEQVVRELREAHASAREERTRIRAVDTFSSADLAPGIRAQWQEIIARHPTVLRCWVVQKEVRYFRRRRCYVLIAEFKSLARRRQATLNALVNELLVEEDAVLVAPAPANVRRALKRKITNVSGALVTGAG